MGHFHLLPPFSLFDFLSISFVAFGLCLSYVSWIVVISDYFHRKYAIVFSLTQSGVGIGIFIFGPLYSFVIDSYGWRGAFLITGGCALQLTVLGALVFPLKKPLRADKMQLDGTEEELLQVSTETKPEQHMDAPLEKQIKPETEVQHSTANAAHPAIPLMKDWCAWCLNLSCFFWLLATSILYILMADYTRFISAEE